jgi:hypothetical protein
VSHSATPAASAILVQASQPVLAGAYEIYVPHQQGRIYFADQPRHVLELLEVLIDLDYRVHRQRDPHGNDLAQRVAEREQVLQGRYGEAEVRVGQHRPPPLYRVGQQVHFFGLSTSYQVVGIGLYEDYRQMGATTWAYFYAGAAGAGRPISEQQTNAAIITPQGRTREDAGD